MSLLTDADELINGERAEQYGDAKEHFKRVAQMWSGILGTPISDDEVGLCMTAFKLVRANTRGEREDLLDAAGYIGCTAKVRAQDDKTAEDYVLDAINRAASLKVRSEAPEDAETEPEASREVAPLTDARVVPLGTEPVRGETEVCSRCGGLFQCAHPCHGRNATPPTVLPEKVRVLTHNYRTGESVVGDEEPPEGQPLTQGILGHTGDVLGLVRGLKDDVRGW